MQQDFQVSLYSPNASVTSHAVPCNSNFCEQQKTGCSGVTSSCPYKVVYVSNDTSSSGIFVEDVMFFRTEDTQSEIVEARIIFGYALLLRLFAFFPVNNFLIN